MSRRAADMHEEEQEFLWGDMLPVGHISVIAGKPGTGKSTLGYRITAECGVPTLFITTEEVDRTVWLPRLMAAGANPEICWHHPEVQFTTSQRDLDYLRKLIREYGIKLIIVDPAQNHLGKSISHDVAVRGMMKPYLDMLAEEKVALLFEAHVLRDVNPNAEAELAFPSGVRGIAKAMYLFSKDPTIGADPEMRILAAAKYNFGRWPLSHRFEFTTSPRKVRPVLGGRRVSREYAVYEDRGPVKVTAKMLLITLAPEDKERKLDRVAWELVEFLRQGQQGRMQSVAAIKKWRLDLDPPTAWKTVERAKAAMPGIESVDDPRNKSKKWWRLTDDQLAELEEATEPEDKLIGEWVDAPDDTFPEDWVEGEDGS